MKKRYSKWRFDGEIREASSWEESAEAIDRWRARLMRHALRRWKEVPQATIEDAFQEVLLRLSAARLLPGPDGKPLFGAMQWAVSSQLRWWHSRESQELTRATDVPFFVPSSLLRDARWNVLFAYLDDCKIESRRQWIECMLRRVEDGDLEVKSKDVAEDLMVSPRRAESIGSEVRNDLQALSVQMGVHMPSREGLVWVRGYVAGERETIQIRASMAVGDVSLWRQGPKRRQRVA